MKAPWKRLGQKARQRVRCGRLGFLKRRCSAPCGLGSVGFGEGIHLVPDQSHNRLCPALERAFDYLMAGLRLGSILRLS